MGGASLPPGFRFHPTDEELVGYYLKRKIDGLKIELEVIPVIDLYKFDPWELPDKSFLPKRDMEWFFFCPRDRKYPNGSRTNRATGAGYWKATGKDRKIVCQSAVTGFRKTLVFYCGRAPLGDRTDWVMHEYRLCDDTSEGSPSFQGAFVLCRVVKKNEQGLQGETKAKKAGGTSTTGNFGKTGSSSNFLGNSIENLSQASILHNGCNYSSPVTSPYELTTTVELEPVSTMANTTSLWVSPDLIFDSSKEYSQGRDTSESLPQNEFPNSIFSWKPSDAANLSPTSSYSNFIEEVNSVDDLGRFGPYSGPINYMGMYGNEEPMYQSFDHPDSPRNLNPFRSLELGSNLQTDQWRWEFGGAK